MSAIALPPSCLPSSRSSRPPAFAQSITGTITGRAVDSSGGVLPGVAVSITSPPMIGGAREAVTDALGTYRFTLVPPGVYQVKFQARQLPHAHRRRRRRQRRRAR